MFVPMTRQIARVLGTVSVFSSSFLASSSSLASVSPLLLSDARDLSSLDAGIVDHTADGHAYRALGALVSRVCLSKVYSSGDRTDDDSMLGTIGYL